MEISNDKKCAALTKLGTPCPAARLKGYDRCFQHSERKETIEKREKARKLGGLSNRVKTVADPKPVLNQQVLAEKCIKLADFILQEILQHPNSHKRNDSLIRLLSECRKLNDTQQMHKRLKKIEEHIKSNGTIDV